MKVKHLLFSSLALSVGFAACTSDVEEFSAQAPVTNPEGIELGEGFSFQVKNAGFGADAETRAHFDKEGTSWKASWDNTDKVGAAMYSMVTGLISNPADANYGKPGSFHNCLTTTPNTYFSNNEFAYQKEEGEVATFTSATNSMVGAYMLYYPYDVTLNQQKAFTQIPVYSGAKAANATSSLTFDAANVENEVNKRIFAATIAKFEDNTNNAPTFQLQQVPNLYMVKFALADHLMLALKEPVKIEHIVMEAKAGSNSAININGYVEPQHKGVTASKFNCYQIGTNPDTFDNLGGIKFIGNVDAPNLTITPDNVPEESDLHINVLGKDARTAPYYFSALPLDGDALGGGNDITELRFTIVAKVNGVDKVFTKVFNAGEEVMGQKSKVLKNETEYYTNWELVQMRTQGMGQVINLGVVLDTEDESTQIYTIGQFADKWAKGQTTFDFAVAGLDFATLETEEFTSDACTEPGTNIVFNGVEQKLAQDIKTTKGGFTFNIPVTIEGDVTADEKDITFEKVVSAITGDVVADSATITFKENVKIKGNVKTLNGGKVIFKKNATIEKNTTITDESVDNGLVSVDAAGEINFEGTAIIVDIASAGTIKFKGDAIINNIEATDGTIEFEGDQEVDVNGTIEAENAAITFKTVVVDGTVDATESTVIFGKDSKANAGIKATNSTITLAGNVTGNVAAESATLSGSATITGNVTLTGSSANFSSVTVNGEISVDAASIINKGTITAGKLTVEGDVLAGVKVAGISEKLTIKPTGVVNVTGSKATSKIAEVAVEKGAAKSGELTANNIVLGNVTNYGTVDGIFAVDGIFNQYASANAAQITVNEGATLNVKTSMTTAGITNNGNIVVDAKTTLTGIIINNADITVNGTLTETATNALTMAETATISVNKNATLSYDPASSCKVGIVYIVNGITAVPKNDIKGAKPGYQKVVAYKWSKTAPLSEIKGMYNRLCVDGATITDQNVNDELLNKKEIALYAGGMKVNTTNPLVLNERLMVLESATISTNSKVNTTFGITSKSYVDEGLTLTLDEKLTLNAGTLNLLKDAEFKGNFVAPAQVKHVNDIPL